jgi:hypothetical protein
MPVNTQSSGQLVAPRYATPTMNAPAPTEIPTGEFRIHHPSTTTSLARADEPVWWWMLFLAPRAGSMLTLWATRNPRNCVITAATLGLLGVIAIVTGVA